MIPSHQRKNFERTDEVIDELEALIFAIDCLHEIDSEKARSASWSLVSIAQNKVISLKHVRQMEWVGIGGAGVDLTEDEAADCLPRQQQAGDAI